MCYEKVGFGARHLNHTMRQQKTLNRKAKGFSIPKLVDEVDFVGMNGTTSGASFLEVFFVNLHSKRALREAVALTSNGSENGRSNAKFLSRKRGATVGFQNFNSGLFIGGVD